MSDQDGPVFPWGLTPGAGRPQPEEPKTEEPKAEGSEGAGSEGAEPTPEAPAPTAPNSSSSGAPPAWTVAPPPAVDAPATPVVPAAAPVPPVAPLPPQPTAPAFPAGWPPADAPAAPPAAQTPPAPTPPTEPFAPPAEPALPRPVWDDPRPTEQAPDYDPEATQAYTPAPPVADDPLAALGLAPAAVLDGPAAASFLPQAPVEPEPTTVLPAAESTGLDALFGADRFREVDELAPAAPPSRRTVARPDPEQEERVGIGRTQRILLIVAGSVVAVLALVVLYLVGTRLGGQAAPAPVPSSEVTGGAEPVALAEPGDHHWEALYGGECLDPFEDAWQDYYTVVDCADPHAAQLALRAPFPEGQPADGSPAAYPGPDALQAEAAELCAGPGVIDLAQAAQYTDLVVQPSYAASAEQWDDGQIFYSCFVSRSSGEPLEGSIAAPQDAGAEE